MAGARNSGDRPEPETGWELGVINLNVHFFLPVREFFVLHRMVGKTRRGVLTPGYFEPCNFPSCSIVWFSLLFTKAYFLPFLDVKLFHLNKLKESHRNVFSCHIYQSYLPTCVLLYPIKISEQEEAKKSVNQTNKKTQVKQFWEFYYLSIFIIIGK